MAHKLANGDYRHKDHLIRCVRVPCSTGWSSEWRIRGLRQYVGVKFDTLKQVCAEIDKVVAASGDASKIA